MGQRQLPAGQKQLAAADKAERIAGFALFILALEHPAQVIAYALEHRAQHFGFAGVELYVYFQRTRRWSCAGAG